MGFDRKAMSEVRQNPGEAKPHQWNGMSARRVMVRHSKIRLRIKEAEEGHQGTFANGTLQSVVAGVRKQETQGGQNKRG